MGIEIDEKRLGNYEILGELGSGGMGVVYRARHVASGQAVALKTVRSDVAGAARWLEGLRREINALTRIRHPGVVRIIDQGAHRGLPWYAMDLLEGERLDDFCRRIWSPYRWGTLAADGSMGLSKTNAVEEGSPSDVPRSSVPPSLPEGKPPAAAGNLQTVLQLMRRVCATLAFLHGEGFINCDVTPRNIVLVAGEPVIIDFGLTVQHPGSSREAAESPHHFGTLPYMSPEQLRGEFVDARSDLYSVGCVLYELVTGRPPFTGTHRVAYVSQHLAAAPTPPSDLVAGIPEALERLMLKLLQKELSDRFGHGDEVALELAELAQDAGRLPQFPPARPYLYRSRLVGRDTVIRQLVELRNRASRGIGGLVFVGGESGVGKTRVALELARREAGSMLRVVTSEASPLAAQDSDTLVHSPLYAVRPVLRAVADRCQEGGPEVTARLLAERRAVLARFEPLLAEVPSNEPLEPEVPLAEHASRQRLFQYLAETIANFALDQPLLWILDDAGWADKLSLAFLRSLNSAFFAVTPILIVATYRSEEPNDDIAAMAGEAHATHLLLERLDDRAIGEMVEDMLALRAVPGSFLSFIADRASGNPFFVSEYLRAAVNDRLLFRGEKNRWQLSNEAAPSLETLAFPRSLQTLIERRLRGLSPAAEQALISAATLGRDVDVDVLPEVSQLEHDAALAAVNELLRHHVFEEVGGRVRFAHDQLRSTAYARISNDLRRTLHRRAALSFEERWANQPNESEIWPTLAHHFERGGALVQAARYLKLAARNARATYANAQAVQLHARAISLLSELSSGGDTSWEDDLLEHRESLGDVFALTSQRDEARRAYDAALERVPEERVVERARLYRKLGKTWEAEHRHDQALHWYSMGRETLESRDLATDAQARDEWIQMHVEELWVRYWLNQVAEMESTVERVSPAIHRSGSPLQRSKFFHAQAMKNLRRDRYLVSSETLELAEKTLEVCSGGGAPLELPMVQFFHGFCLLLHGSWDRAEGALDKALAMAERAGEIGHEARCMTYRTVLWRMRGDVERAHECVRRTLDLSLRAGLREYAAAAWANQAWVSLRLGEREQARSHAARATAAWEQFPAVFPFHWLALLPSISLELADGALPRAFELVEALVAPAQHAMLPGAMAAFQGTLRLWQSDDATGARVELDRVLNALGDRGYS